MAVDIHGLAVRDDDTAFAFVALRLRAAIERAELGDVLAHLAAVVPDADAFVDELPDELDEAVQLVAIPWQPPETAHELEVQRRIFERAAAVGVESAWCFQAGSVDDGELPHADELRCPLDGDDADVDADDLGIAFKLAGKPVGGEAGVLAAFHALWLAAYCGDHRNAAVTYDRTHHAAHLWVDGLDTPCAPEALAGHLRWIAARIDLVMPLIHARFAGATIPQKYGVLLGDASEAFVLGGNPLLAVHAAGGDAEVDTWLAQQREWSNEEVARMLRELAIELVTGDDAGRDADDAGGDDLDDDDDDPGRHIATHAGELLCSRALVGKLDARAPARLLAVLDEPAATDARRRAIVDVLGAARHRAAVPALIHLLETTHIDGALDATGKEELIASTAAALGAIGELQAIDVLARVAAAPGPHNDRPRPAAADALATCLASAPEPRDVDDAVLARLLETIRDRNDGELNAEAHFAYGRIARVLHPVRRDEARRRLAAVDSARDDMTVLLARHAALALAAPAGPAGAPPPELRALLREALTALDYDHDHTVRNIRVALRVAEAMPELVDPPDLVWLTRFGEPDIRGRAHALLARRGHPLSPAPVFDRTSARDLDDRELVRALGEGHIVHRAALITEAGRRRLRAAWPAIVDACHEVITRARQGGANLLDPDTRVLDAAVPLLRVPPLDDATVALFDRMLRHSNFHVKWRLLEAMPHDERMIGGMFHVLGERWGWQEKAARQWLARFQGSAAYEQERRRAGSADVDAEPQPDADPDLEIN